MTRFTLAQYQENEAYNDHTENAVQLVNSFGTEDEKRQVSQIAYEHEKQGYLTYDQSSLRYELTQKYYRTLKALS